MNIRKQLIFMRRFFTTTHRRRRWMKPQVLLVMCAFAAFLVVLLWTPPFSAHGAGPTATPATTIAVQPPLEFTKTPFPPEFISNSQQTIGITFAGAILVLIVVIGVIAFMPKKID